ncbi:class I SAM-dependent methyltransferase [Chryseolinea lacunae]|uniref:Class I SAM-dependent methyltransferase n=1 Tax=Chryseolinea lacunae TaxID=2801331 RepID=A0ABS1KUF2_9BACT|nr:class I SAM-dependent methyltransferase [Chryseolinea lacunae]MBL0743049.1 class I SAM-dependent methyltransferase [Chryseolinea lacunae]
MTMNEYLELKEIDLDEHVHDVKRKLKDVYAFNILQTLLEGPYLPMSNSAMGPVDLTYLLNDIVVNGRQNILEFGAGMSTILMGRLIRKNKLTATVTTVEHDLKWVKVMETLIKNERLDDVLSVIYAPLKPCPLALQSNVWYDLNVLNLFAGPWDMVVIDGPPAWEETKGQARYPAMQFVMTKLAPNAIVFLDDADRPGEQSILHHWEDEFGISFKIRNGSLGYFVKGHSFNIDPF